jgi:N-acetyl-gamma-glutamyl-phosphate reductase
MMASISAPSGILRTLVPAMRRGMSTGNKQYRVGLVGARGYVGMELMRLVAEHPQLQLALASSRSLKGPVADVAAVDGAALNADEPDIAFAAHTPADVAAAGLDVCYLAMPNGLAAPFVEALEATGSEAVMVDLSADYRFDDSWTYGLPEAGRGAGRERLRGAKRISNPGCYATGAQLSLLPLQGRLAAPAQVFGVSGYSGAGTTPSDKNNPEKLANNVMPYAQTGHIHEREVTRHLGEEVFFMPHVAPHFRGIQITTSAQLREATTAAELEETFRAYYQDEPLVQVKIPEVAHIANEHHACVGGFTMGSDGTRVVINATIDNLLKGAATQAMQNTNLSLGLPERAGIGGGA